MSKTTSFVRSLRKRLDEGYSGEAVSKVFSEALEQKKIQPKDIVLAELTRTLLGEDYLTISRKAKAIAEGKTHLLEAGDAVDASTFSNITGQLLITEIKDKYESAEFMARKLFRKVPNPGGNLREHIVPYLSNVVDKGEKLAALQTYPRTEFQESWIRMPAPEKHGQICAVSMEMMMTDLTGQAQDSAASIGEALGYLDEERHLRVLLGLVNNHHWNGNTLNTYVATAGVGNYVTRLLSTTISNYTHINSVEQLFRRRKDPITGRLILAKPTTILCMPEKKYELKRVLNATEVRDATTGLHNVSDNPLDTRYPLMDSAIARDLLIGAGISEANTKERVYFMDPQKAFATRVVYDLQTEQAPALNPDEFNKDIVLQVKAGFFNVPFVYDPRYTTQSTAEAA